MRELISARQFASQPMEQGSWSENQPMEQGSWSDSSWWGAAKEVSSEECVHTHTHMHMSLRGVQWMVCSSSSQTT